MTFHMLKKKVQHLTLNIDGVSIGKFEEFILALKVILLDRLQGINCSVIQEP